MHRIRQVVLRCGLTAFCLGLVAGVWAGPAAADRAFSPRFVVNANGGIAQAANTLETCPPAATGCPAARDGMGSLLDNNDFAMQYVDTDSDPATFDSSSAQLALPPGAHVLFAGLYVGGRTEPGTRGLRPRDASPQALGTVLLRAPGESSYVRLGPEGATLDQSASVRGAYQAVHDVTDLVRRAGAGEYTVADVQAGTGVDRYAGWALEVAYAAPGDPPRNLSIFDGLQSVTRGQPPLTVALAGFQTPLEGPVRTQVGVVAYEGDLGSGGDSMSLNGHPLSDAVDSATDFFDSGISVDGAPSTDKTPDYRNQLGFDAKLVTADGALSNAATSGAITLTTSLEQYLPGMVAFATDLFAPDLQVEKSVANLSQPGGPARAGDRLRYAIAYRNTGQASARDVIAADQLPAGVTLLPGSLRLADEGGVTELTDAPGDDVGAYDPSDRTVRVFLGQGATPDRGGSLSPAPGLASNATVSFDVEVDDATQTGEIANSASATADAPSLAGPLQVVSNPATIEVRPTERPPGVADLGTSEQQTDDRSAGVSETSDAVTITDHGPADATDVRAQIDVAPGEAVESVHAPDASCTPDGRGVACDVARLDAGASAQVDLVEDATGPEDVVAPTEVTAVASQLDEDAADNTAITPLEPAAPALPAGDDATLATMVQPASQIAAVGGRFDETVAVHDLGPGAAEPLSIDATPSLPVSMVTAGAPGLRCRVGLIVRCTGGRLSPGRTVDLRLSGRPQRPGRLMWTVDASSDRLDAHPGRQSAHAIVSVHGPQRALALSLDAAPTVVAPGQAATIRLSVRNELATDVTGAQVCVRVGPRLALARSATGVGTVDRRCVHLATLPGDGRRQIRVPVQARPGATPGPVTISAVGRVAGVPPARATTRLTIHPAFTGCAAPPSAVGWTLWPDC